MAEIKIDYRKCTGCGICASVCPVEMYEIANGKPKIKAKPESCVLCRACENTCPAEAITVEEI